MNKRIVVKGAVQGIGYRPFVSEKATEYGLKGYVKNLGASVEILASGKLKDIEAFTLALKNEVPPGGFVISLEAESLTDTSEYLDFSIIDSSDLDISKELPVFLPDIGICNDCMNEMLESNDRRYRYPLISCAVCGPRMSILNRLPYDRNNTTMESFKMCPSCLKEYGKGRRKYAQTISCHSCGPQMHFKTFENSFFSNGQVTETSGEEAVKASISMLKEGAIIGLKGISGYQLVALPKRDVAKRLRRIKGRENKPFALMFSTVADIKKTAYVSSKEEALLVSSARPIVLLNKKNPAENNTDSIIEKDIFSDEVIKGSRYVGAFLPSAGIHRLLTDELGPLIVTSANKSDESMIIDDSEFVETFMNPEGNIESSVDGVLYHERKINMPQDDSVMFVISCNKEETAQFIRRARGFAPLPILLNKSGKDDRSVFATGGDLKSTFSFGKHDRIIPSQYIGDLKDYAVQKNFKNLYEDYRKIFCFKPDIVVKDLHPEYISSQISNKLFHDRDISLIELQHHISHTYSVMAENTLDSSIGVAFDGTGFGLDERIWGGEFFYVNKKEATRMGHLSYVRLAGGNVAPKDAGSVSLCYAYLSGITQPVDEGQSFGASDKAFSLLISEERKKKDKYLKAALKNNINTFETSSMGRLFDAVSALLGICDYNTYEGEAAIKLESRALDFITSLDFPKFSFEITDHEDGFLADQLKLFSDIYRCLESQKYSIEAISFGFHRAICDMIVNACDIIRRKTGENKVCLSGGVFNNRLLLTETAEALFNSHFEVFWNRKVPLGDGGISLGQAYYGLMCDAKT